MVIDLELMQQLQLETQIYLAMIELKLVHGTASEASSQEMLPLEIPSLKMAKVKPEKLG